MTDEDLILTAADARERAYAPYSEFKVGAALLCTDGSVYTGSNIENASYGATNCAERTAIFQAVHDGQRDFSAIAIVGWKDGTAENLCFPCGICRQVMLEFCDPSFRILLRDRSGEIRTYTLRSLMPDGFILHQPEQS